MAALALDISERFACTAGGLRRARALTRSAVGPVWAALADDAELCVGEAFGNALRHTRSGRDGGDVGLHLYALPCGPLYIDLSDDGPLRPGDRPAIRPGAGGLEAESGRGLLLIESLTAHWFYVPTGPAGGLLCLTLLTTRPSLR
ncbi:MAG: ATP-binding protein [Nocardiopsaceae bacterium]|nr:ATP-binding protein [Nocardiopsaceae bacterium]